MEKRSIGNFMVVGMLLLAGSVGADRFVFAEEATSTTKTKMITPRSLTTTENKKNTTQGGKVSLPDAENIPGSVPNILKRLDELTRHVDTLSKRLAKLEQGQNELRNELKVLKEKTRGPECSPDASISTNPATGETQNCKPYQCNPVSGLCETGCTYSDRCAMGYVCYEYHCVSP